MDKKDMSELFNNFLIGNEKTNRYYDSNEYGNYFDANYPDSLLIKVKKGGSAGGNCYNDDPSEEYDNSYMEGDIVYAITTSIEPLCNNLNIDVNSELVKSVLGGLAFMIVLEPMKTEVHEETIDEYYGNCTIEGIYAIKLTEIVKPLVTEEEYKIFQERLETFIVEKKPEISQQEVAAVKSNKKYN